MTRYVLALDLGTSGVRCMLADSSLCPVAWSQQPLSYFSPADCSVLARELDPQVLMDQVETVVASVLKQPGTAPRDIAAIGVTSQRQGVAFVDRDRNTLCLSPNLDMRAVFEGAAIDDEVGPREVYRTTGHFPSFMLAPSRVRWFRQNRDGDFSRLGWVMPLASWLAWRLTGIAASEISLDAEAGLVDISTGGRNPSFLERCGVDPGWLPPLVAVGTPVGGLAKDIGQAWGLPPGTPVTVAGPDTQCALIGMGLGTPGQTAVVLGWSGTLQSVTSAPCFDDEMRTWAGCFSGYHQWVAEANLGDTGNAFGWLKELLLGHDVSFQQADALASATPAGSEGVMALLGPGHQAAPRLGLRTGGLLMPVPVAFQRTTPAQALRAALENVAYSVRSNLGTLYQVTGGVPDRLYAAGGMASSDLLAQVLADVLDLPVVRSQYSQETCQGAAVAAAVAAGLYRGFDEATDHRRHQVRISNPVPHEVADYQDHYQRWLELSQAIGAIV